MEDHGAQASDMQLYQQLYQLKVLLDRIQMNLNSINSAPNAQTVTVIGGNLFQLALQYYQDATQWPLIAKANGLTDPLIVGSATLIIPPLNGQDMGGILQ